MRPNAECIQLIIGDHEFTAKLLTIDLMERYADVINGVMTGSTSQDVKNFAPIAEIIFECVSPYDAEITLPDIKATLSIKAAIPALNRLLTGDRPAPKES